MAKVYHCNKCNAVWFDEELAKKCEATHLDPEYYDAEYTPTLQYPSTIECGFNDEVKCVYQLVEIKWPERE